MDRELTKQIGDLEATRYSRLASAAFMLPSGWTDLGDGKLAPFYTEAQRQFSDRMAAEVKEIDAKLRELTLRTLP